jgi:hypothetical protein
MRYAILLVSAALMSMTTGCLTPVFKEATTNLTETTKSTGDWISRTLGKGQASDPRARDIEERLGYGDMLDY